MRNRASTCATGFQILALMSLISLLNCNGLFSDVIVAILILRAKM